MVRILNRNMRVHRAESPCPISSLLLFFPRGNHSFQVLVSCWKYPLHLQANMDIYSSATSFLKIYMYTHDSDYTHSFTHCFFPLKLIFGDCFTKTVGRKNPGSQTQNSTMETTGWRWCFVAVSLLAVPLHKPCFLFQAGLALEEVEAETQPRIGEELSPIIDKTWGHDPGLPLTHGALGQVTQTLWAWKVLDTMGLLQFQCQLNQCFLDKSHFLI